MATDATWTSEQMMPEWIAMEHYRLHTVEQWPDGPYKTATLDAIHASLTSLTRDTPQSPVCSICSKRRNAQGILEFPAAAKPRRSENPDFERIAS